MDKVYLNLMKSSGTHVTGGHRSSNGWVTCWTNYIHYNLTVSSDIQNLSLATCSIIKDYLLRYPDHQEHEDDWGVYISNSHTEENIEIKELIQILNNSQSAYIFEDSPIAQPHHINRILENSLYVHHAALKVIESTKSELREKILTLQFKYKKLTAERIFRHLKLLIEHNQVDFNSRYADLEYYPLDIIAINKDYDLLVRCILSYAPSYSNANDIYAVLTTGKYSYFDIKEGAVPQLTHEENHKLSSFINEIEKTYAERYIHGSDTSHLPLQGGMTHLVIHYLLNRDYDSYYKLMNNRCYKSIENRYDGFKIILRLAYISDCRWDKVSLDSSCNDWDSDSRLIRECLLGTIVKSPYWVPFLKRILENDESIEKLSQFFRECYHKLTKEYVCERIEGIIKEYE